MTDQSLPSEPIENGDSNPDSIEEEIYPTFDKREVSDGTNSSADSDVDKSEVDSQINNEASSRVADYKDSEDDENPSVNQDGTEVKGDDSSSVNQDGTEVNGDDSSSVNQDGTEDERVDQAQQTRKPFDENLTDATEQVDQDQKTKERARRAEFEHRHINISRIEKKYLERARNLYVKPNTYAPFAEMVFTQDQSKLKSTSDRIWLIAGTPRSGRVITAIRIALDLMDLQADRAESIWIYEDSDRTLQEIAADKTLPDNSVIIFENVFDRGRMRSDALFSQVRDLNSNLAQRKVHFIFTVLENDENFPLQDLRGRYPILISVQPTLIEVFHKFVDVYFPEIINPDENKRLKELAPTISAAFQPPRRAADIDYWFRLHGGNAKELERFLQSGAFQESLETRHWFENLPNLNYKLYALLVVLFDGLDYIWLEQIYEASVAQLRNMGMDGDDQFIDPRRIGIYALESRLQLRKRGTQIDFIDDIFRIEVQRQIENHQRLLWTLVDSFIAVIRTINESFVSTRKLNSKLKRRRETLDNPLLQRRLIATSQDMDNMRRLRDVIAKALASLGVFHIEFLRNKLNDLVQDDAAFVVLTASGILANMGCEDDYQELVIDILSEWVRSGDFDCMWAAAVSISRVYEAVVRKISLDDVYIPATLTVDNQADRPKIKARNFLLDLGKLLEELARNYNNYDEVYKQQKRDAIHNLLLNQLEDEFSQLVQEGVHTGDITTDVLKTYQEAKSEERILLALHLIPDAQQQLQQKVESIFLTQIDSWCDQIRLGVVEAAAYIASSRPLEMVHLVESWVSGEDNEDPVWQIGYMTLNRLFQQTEHLDVILLEKRAFPLLQSFETLIRVRRPMITGLWEMLKGLSYDETVVEEQEQKHRELINLLTSDPLSTALKAILTWYQKAIEQLNQYKVDIDETDFDDHPEISDAVLSLVENRAEIWESQVYPEILKAINQATYEQRIQFRKAIIDEWLIPEHDQSERVRRVAHALIARSHIMDGLVVDLPQAQRVGVFIIDGSADDASINDMFALAQRLSAVVPLYILNLGDARRTYIEGIWESRNLSSEQKIQYVTVSDISDQGRHRPPLLMPLLQSREWDDHNKFTPDQTYFILVHTSRTIADLPDFFANLTVQPQMASNTGNIFAQRRKEQTHTVEEQEWEWADKLFIISNSSQSFPAHARGLISFTSQNSIDYTYSQLQHQVTKMLHQMTSANEMWRNIEGYLGFAVPRTVTELKPFIEQWLLLLNDIQYTHPRNDASLTIAWVLLALSREGEQGCRNAVSIIEYLLEKPDDDIVANIQHQMGMACARMLFNFYNAFPSNLSVEIHGALLRLLPAFNRAARDYSDLISIWDVLITWGQSTTWLSVLEPATELEEIETDGSKLYESVDTLKEREARAARNWLQRYERLPEIWDLFIDIGKSVDEFIGLILKAHTYRQNVNAHKSNKGKINRRQPAPQAPLTEPHLTKLLSFIPEDLERDSLGISVLQWQIDQISANQRELLSSKHKDTLLQRARNMQTLAERLRDRLSLRIAGQLPILTNNEKFYGILIVQADNKLLTAKAADLARIFAQMRKRGELKEVVLTMHRQGSQDMVRHIRKAVKRKENDLYEAQKRIPLLGPALDRYVDDQVGFVVVLSERQVLDYDDWGEREGWGERLWTIRPKNAKWQPSRGEHFNLSESSDVIMDQIVMSIMQRNKAK